MGNEMKFGPHVYRMQIAKSMIGDKKGRLLDIGCAYGELEKILPDVDYTGLDNFAHDPHPKSFVLHDMDKDRRLPFADKSFDIIVCTEVLEHIRYPDEIAEEIKRILKTDGFAIISIPNELSIYERLILLTGRNVIAEAGHLWSFDKKRAREFMQKHFVVVEERRPPPAQLRFLAPLANIRPSLFANWFFFKIKRS